MKQNLFNKLWLRVGMIVAIMTTALSGTAWAETYVWTTANSQLSTSTSSFTINDVAWSFTPTWTDASKKYVSWIGGSTNCYQIGSSKNIMTALTISTTGISGTISEVEVIWSSAGANAASLAVSVGSTSFTSNSASSSSSTLQTSTYSGEASGTLSLNFTCTTGIKLQKVTVTYTPGGSSAVETTTTINADGITNTDVYTSTVAGSLSATVVDEDDNAIPGGASVTWSGNNNAVATIDASTGVVTLVDAGTVTFTATYAGTTGYSGSYATYKMTVTSSAPYVQPTEIEITPNYTFWGKEEQFSGNDFSELSGSKDNVTLNWTKGDGSTYANTTAMRFYKDNDLTFTAPEGYEIKSIVLTVSGTYGDLTFSPTGFDSENTTWSGSSSTVTMSRPSNGSSYATISKFTITIGQASTDPSISADNVEIAYNATEGSIAFTVTNPVDGGQVSATTEANWLTSGSATSTSPISFTCSANSETTARTATVTLTYTYNSSETVTTTVTVTQAAAPVIYTTISDLFEAATNTATEVNITFGGWVVSGVNGSQVFVTDGTNGLIIYQSGHGFEVGNTLSGTASCNLVLFNGSAELTGLTSTTEGLTVGTNGSVTPVATTIDALGAVNTGSVVTLSNLTCSVSTSGNYTNYDLSDGTNTIRAFSSIYDFTANPDLEDGNTYSVTGIFCYNTSAVRILPRSAADIEEVQVQHNEYALTVSNLENVEMFVFDATDQSSALIDGEGSAQVYDGTQVLISVSAEAGYELESLIVDGNDVTSEIVSDAYTFTMPTHAVTVTATAVAVTPVTNKTLTNANIVAAGDAANSYSNYSITDENGKTWNAYAIKNQHSNATSGYHYLQIKKYASNTAYYLQVPEYGTKITSITMTVSSTQKPMTDGENTATLFFSNSNSTSAAGEGVASGTGASEVTIDCSSLNLNTGYITASAGVRIWDVTVVYEYAPSTITLNASGYATFASTSVVDFTDAETNGYSAWAVTDVSGSEITFSQITGAVPAGTGVLLKGEASAPVTLSYTTSGTAVAGNKLVGITAETPIAANQYYGLSGTSFVKVNAGIVKAGKALLPASVVNGTEVKALTFVFEDDDATGLERVQDVQDVQGAIYNLAGQRLNKMQKGINIVNGKKILK